MKKPTDEDPYPGITYIINVALILFKAIKDEIDYRRENKRDV